MNRKGGITPHPVHPRPGQGPSRIELNIDRGLASGKLDVMEVSVDEALRLASRLLEVAIIVKRVNSEKGHDATA